MIGLDCQFDNRPLVLRRHLADDLLQAVAYRPNKHLAPPLGTPDDMVHDEMDVVPLMCVVHVDSIPLFNTARTADRPFIPRLKPGTFWPQSCKIGDRRVPCHLYAARRCLWGNDRARSASTEIFDTYY